MHHTAEANNNRRFTAREELLQAGFRLPILFVVKKEPHHLVVSRPSGWRLEKMTAYSIECKLIRIPIGSQGIAHRGRSLPDSMWIDHRGTQLTHLGSTKICVLGKVKRNIR